jgi:NAD(P)-dependent dehydrogenase (short-subunit alcohol dehydrogenase family)
MQMDDKLVSSFSLRGRQALVTGASSGVGRHMATVLARAGAGVVVAARQMDKLQALVSELSSLGVPARALAMDVGDAATVRTAFETLDHDGIAVDILVNNAGVTVSKPLLAQTEDDWDHVLNTNLRGAFLVAKEAAARMVARQSGGAIVNVASILGERVAGAVGPYSASKAALIQLTKSMALEWARHGIRCNALLPGYLVTDLNRDFLSSEAGERLRQRVPSRRFGTLDDLDGPMLLLTSDAGRHITGTTLAVDGGHLVSSL